MAAAGMMAGTMSKAETLTTHSEDVKHLTDKIEFMADTQFSPSDRNALVGLVQVIESNSVGYKFYEEGKETVVQEKLDREGQFTVSFNKDTGYMVMETPDFIIGYGQMDEKFQPVFPDKGNAKCFGIIVQNRKGDFIQAVAVDKQFSQNHTFKNTKPRSETLANPLDIKATGVSGYFIGDQSTWAARDRIRRANRESTKGTDLTGK